MVYQYMLLEDPSLLNDILMHFVSGKKIIIINFEGLVEILCIKPG